VKKPVWHSEEKGTAREEFVAFSAGRDVVPLPMADDILIPYDIWTNQAHAKMLYQIGVFRREELERVLESLNELERLWEQGQWRLDPALEDVHINLESALAERCGEEISGKLHTGRSRNDQVATDMKLYARGILFALLEETLLLIETVIRQALEYREAVMPGYTHHRKATLTTWGHWCAAYAQSLLRDVHRMKSCYERMNFSPLGAAASYGTTWNLNRTYTAELLAFDGVQENTLDAITARGETETEITHLAALHLKGLSIIAQDLILFSTEEFGYLSLPAEFTTGSSIMPQKRNPDFAEAIKGKAHLVQGYAVSLLSMNSGNFSGYNKDIQWSKYVFMDAVRETQGAAGILANVFQGLVVHRERMLKAAGLGFLNAVDIADHLARTRNVPFRKTYQLMSDVVGLSKEHTFDLPVLNDLLHAAQIDVLTREEFDNLSDPCKCVYSRDHLGSPHPERVRNHLRELHKKVDVYRRWVESQIARIQGARQRNRKID
jgi:argininosuccinate lyase